MTSIEYKLKSGSCHNRSFTRVQDVNHRDFVAIRLRHKRVRSGSHRSTVSRHSFHSPRLPHQFSAKSRGWPLCGRILRWNDHTHVMHRPNGGMQPFLSPEKWPRVHLPIRASMRSTLSMLNFCYASRFDGLGAEFNYVNDSRPEDDALNGMSCDMYLLYYCQYKSSLRGLNWMLTYLTQTCASQCDTWIFIE